MCFTVEIGHLPSCPLIAMRSPVEKELVDRAGLPVSQGDCPADQLLFGSMQFAEDVHGSLVAGARSTHGPRVLPFGSSSSSTRSPAGVISYLPSRCTSHPALIISRAVCTATKRMTSAGVVEPV